MAPRRDRFIDLRKSRGFTQETFAEALKVDRTTVQRWEKGESDPQPWSRPAIVSLLDITPSQLDDFLSSEVDSPTQQPQIIVGKDFLFDDEFEALELARRAQASDVGKETLLHLQRSFDRLASEYPISSPHELLDRVRQNLHYVSHLMDARKTLSEHRQLLVLGGWFSLLGATLHIDLQQDIAASARLESAMSLGRQAEHSEIQAWCYETEAWRVLTDGDYKKAAKLSQAAQYHAPIGSSVAIQSTAQEGRAQARIGLSKETYEAIDKVQKLSEGLKISKNPQHHYQYDPGKSLAYATTTLSWLGDPVAEEYARNLIAGLEPGADVKKWPRRLASAKLDLSLALLSGNKLDEACDSAQSAILSGRVAPSNHWRAWEIVKAVEGRNLPEAVDLREAFQELRSNEKSPAHKVN
ncbi:helix-turn-helix domain-containing protein [Streptomyces xiamenensis]|uniref:helix-turn-helix domain-containing protein n=1 Tax=Streptomyces xiamenensis TaxID=408015 RepID=UPI003D7075C0